MVAGTQKKAYVSPLFLDFSQYSRVSAFGFYSFVVLDILSTCEDQRGDRKEAGRRKKKHITSCLALLDWGEGGGVIYVFSFFSFFLIV